MAFKIGKKQSPKNVIYGIKDNTTNKYLYVGETTREAEVRFNEHLRKLKDGWHENLRLQIAYDNCDGNVSFDVLEIVQTITERERYWINELLASNDLTNEA
jgi:hypothetical protein